MGPRVSWSSILLVILLYPCTVIVRKDAKKTENEEGRLCCHILKIGGISIGGAMAPCPLGYAYAMHSLYVQLPRDINQIIFDVCAKMLYGSIIIGFVCNLSWYVI